MKNVLFYQLNLNFYSENLGTKKFELISNNLKYLKENLDSGNEISDLKLAVEIYSQLLPDGALRDKKLLKKILISLPIITQEKILSLGKVKNFDELLKNIDLIKDIFINDFNTEERYFYKTIDEIETKESNFFFAPPDITIKKLKDYQSELFFRAKKYLFSTPYSRAIIQMPTGSGKTRTAMELVCDYINEFKKDVIWLANTEELCDQAFDSFNEVFNFNRLISAGSINHLREKSFKKHHQIPYFHVMSIQSLNSIHDSEKLLSKFSIKKSEIGMVIVDEAHISIAPTYKKSIEFLLKNYDVKLIGLTATPGRGLNDQGSKSDENKKLSDFFYNKKFEIEISDENPLIYLRKKGILSAAKYTSIEGSVFSEKLTQKEIEDIQIRDKYPKRVIDFLTKDEGRNYVIFSQIKKRCEEGKKVLFFGNSIDHSVLINTLLNNQGISSQHVDGSTGKNRKLIIDNFRKNKTQVLCNFGVLSTGFDDPKVDVVFISRKTASIVLYSQLIGRGLRGPKIGGTEKCEIITIDDNLVTLPSNNEIYDYFNGYFE